MVAVTLEQSLDDGWRESERDRRSAADDLERAEHLPAGPEVRVTPGDLFRRLRQLQAQAARACKHRACKNLGGPAQTGRHGLLHEAATVSSTAVRRVGRRLIAGSFISATLLLPATAFA